jgi:hypothetical protein
MTGSGKIITFAVVVCGIVAALIGAGFLGLLWWATT